MRIAAAFHIARRCTAQIAIAGFAATAWAAESPPPADAPQPVKDAWIDGRLETAYALNEQLHGFDIETQVRGGVVALAGTVESEIDRKLAMEIASAVQGVQNVQDSLTVDAAEKPSISRIGAREQRSFGQQISDATASARVKSNLVANGNTKGLSINVDAENDVVILTGAVPSRKDKMLAEMIARNTDGIANVRNQLEINEQT